MATIEKNLSWIAFVDGSLLFGAIMVLYNKHSTFTQQQPWLLIVDVYAMILPSRVKRKYVIRLSVGCVISNRLRITLATRSECVHTNSSKRNSGCTTGSRIIFTVIITLVAVAFARCFRVKYLVNNYFKFIRKEQFSCPTRALIIKQCQQIQRVFDNKFRKLTSKLILFFMFSYIACMRSMMSSKLNNV